MNHSFDIELAQKYGVNIAIFLNHIAFWIQKNVANNKHFINGRWWTYSSQSGLLEIFPYWSRKVLRKLIDSCVEQNIIIVDKFNKAKYDHTNWYAFTDQGLKLFPLIEELINTNGSEIEQSSIGPRGPVDCTLWEPSIGPRGPTDWPQRANRLALEGQPIPYTITDTITDIEKAPPVDNFAATPSLLPIDFEFSPQQCDIANQYGINSDLELSKFKTHYRDQKRSDWNKKAELWLLRAIEFKKNNIHSLKKLEKGSNRPRLRDYTAERIARELEEEQRSTRNILMVNDG